MATTKDAEAGWNIYRDADYALSMSEINDELVRRGHAPIKERTYRHYGKLQRYGYTRYLPINQLDVKTLRDPFLDQSSRSRQHPIQTITSVVLRVLDSGSLVEFEGQAIELSTNEAVVRFEGSRTTEFFDGLGRTTPVGELVFLDTGEVRRGRLERLTLDVDSQLSTVRLNFAGSVDLHHIVGIEAPDRATFRVSIGTDDLPGLGDIARHLYWLAQASDAARAVVAEVCEELSAPQFLDLAPPRVTQVSIGSIDITIDAAHVTTIVLLSGIRGTLALRQLYWQSEKTKQEAIRLRWQNDEDGVRSEAAMRRIASGMVETLRRLLRRLGVDDKDEADMGRATDIAARQVLPALDEVIDLSDGEIEITLDSVPDALAAELDAATEPVELDEADDKAQPEE